MLMLILISIFLLAQTVRGSTNWTAPLHPNDNSIPNHYMVSFKGNHSIAEHQATIGRPITSLIRHTWDVAPFGYAAKLDNDTLELIRADPNVAFVEQDFYLTIVNYKDLGPGKGLPSNTSSRQILRNSSVNATILSERSKQNGAPWNLEVISANGKRVAGSGYQYDVQALGANVDVYIMDSGIRTSHVEFSSRASNFCDTTDTTFYDESEPYGHGTEVAGVVGGSFYGVAKDVNLLSCKIVHGPASSGSGANAVNAIKLATRRHRRRKSDPNFRGSIINYSVNLPPPLKQKASLQQAITAADYENIIQVAAAGNSGNDAVNQLPAAYSETITVASMLDNYEVARSSSYGTSVAIIAPGGGIESASPESDTATRILTGTSFAAPHVSGVIAQFMSYSSGPQTKAAVYKMLMNFSINNVVAIPSTKSATPNRLVNNGYLSQAWPPHDEL